MKLITLQIRALPDRSKEPPAARRLAQWLKLGLRVFRLQCVNVSEATHEACESQSCVSEAGNVPVRAAKVDDRRISRTVSAERSQSSMPVRKGVNAVGRSKTVEVIGERDVTAGVSGIGGSS